MWGGGEAGQAREEEDLQVGGEAGGRGLGGRTHDKWEEQLRQAHDEEDQRGGGDGRGGGSLSVGRRGGRLCILWPAWPSMMCDLHDV